MNERESQEQVHQAVSTSSGPTGGLTSQTASGNTAAPTEVDTPSRDCHCEACDPIRYEVDADGHLHSPNMRMIVCAICGNKRCPHATNHRNACTNSNAVGQPGSSWEHVKPWPIQPQGAASPPGAMLDAEAAKPPASNGPDGPASAALPADLTALLLQAVEALELGRDYIKAELTHRKDAYEGYPHRYATEEEDLAHVDRVAAALRQRIGRE